LKNTNEELVKKSEELNEGINKLQQKIKEIEDELNEENSSDASSKNSLTKS
jgi:prefoldin subunit 5